MSRESEIVSFITARLDEEGQTAQVAAMRKLMEAHVGYYGPGDDEFFPVPTLSTLAAIWEDHADYPAMLKAEGAPDA